MPDNRFTFTGPGVLTITDEYGNLVISVPFNHLDMLNSHVQYDEPLSWLPSTASRVTYDVRFSSNFAPGKTMLTIGEAAYGPPSPNQEEIEGLL